MICGSVLIGCLSVLSTARTGSTSQKENKILNKEDRHRTMIHTMMSKWIASPINTLCTRSTEEWASSAPPSSHTTQQQPVGETVTSTPSAVHQHCSNTWAVWPNPGNRNDNRQFSVMLFSRPLEGIRALATPIDLSYGFARHLIHWQFLREDKLQTIRQKSSVGYLQMQQAGNLWPLARESLKLLPQDC